MLDHPMPAATADAIVRQSTRGRSRRWRTATVGATLLAATAAAAMPRSPLRRWLAESGAGDQAAPRPREPSTPAIATNTVPASRSIAVPAGDSMEVVFATWQSGGRVTVRLTSGGDARLETRDATAEFAVGRSAVRVRNGPSAASYELSVPAAADPLRVVVEGAVVLERRGGRAGTGAAPDSAGHLTISLSRPAQR